MHRTNQTLADTHGPPETHDTVQGNPVRVRPVASAPPKMLWHARMTERSDRFIAYPNRAVVAVVDDPAEAQTATAELRAAGFDDDAVTVLQGPAGADRFDGMGRAHGLGSRLRRLLAFTVMDQLPDFVLYERALRDGRSVVIVRAPGDADKRRAHDILRARGGHFMNYYGRFATEEVSRWTGPEPEVSDLLKR